MSGRAVLKRAYVVAARLLGIEGRLLRRIAREGLVVVLNLHRVSPEKNDFYQPLHPRLFEELLVFLKERFWVTTFGELAAASPRPRPPAVLSFDDGFHDFVEYAAPLLAKHGLRANQNVIVASVMTGERPWTQRLNDFLAAAPPPLLREMRLPGFRRRPNGSPEERSRFGAALGSYLISRSRGERVALWQQLEELMARLDDAPATRMMSLADVREMAKTHEIGVHSNSHEPMDVESTSYFQDDLARCSAFFRDRLELPMAVYAFPYGRCRQEQIDLLLQHAEVKAILLVGDRFARPGGPVYPRFNIGAVTAAELRLEALGYRARPI